MECAVMKPPAQLREGEGPVDKWLSPVARIEQVVTAKLPPSLHTTLKPQLVDLLVDMLQIDPRLRPTPAQLMQRPIFDHARQQEARYLQR
jgi:serine/threonine protein kinase